MAVDAVRRKRQLGVTLLEATLGPVSNKWAHARPSPPQRNLTLLPMTKDTLPGTKGRLDCLQLRVEGATFMGANLRTGLKESCLEILEAIEHLFTCQFFCKTSWERHICMLSGAANTSRLAYNWLDRS